MTIGFPRIKLPNRRLITLHYLNTRNLIGQCLNQLGLIGEGAEIGTHRGEFASIIMQHWHGRKLNCIDHWKSGYDPGDPASNGDRQEDYEMTVKNLCHYSSRVEIHKLSSYYASHKFPSKSLDFVYIDACHRYASLIEDLYIWWERIKDGGLLMGHDILCPTEVNGGWENEIQPAVFEFAIDKGVMIELIREEVTNLPWSYLIYKG